jgi:hypothetical protein
VSPTSAIDLALYYWSIESLRLPFGLIAAGCLLAVIFGNSPRRRTQEKVTRARARYRWRWPFGRKRIPWPLGPVTVDLRGGHHTIHAVVAGMSGTGKSTAVVSLLERTGPALVVAFDNSRPIRELFEAKGWTIWTPGGTLGWDVVSGPAQVVSEALVAGMPESNQSMGIMSGMAQERIWETLEVLDRVGRPRTIDALADALSVRTGNPIQDRACLDWAVRFRRVARSLGSSLGTDLDLGAAMRAGDKVLILPNRFLSPKDAPLVGAMALVQARRVAQEVGDFIIVVEEAGQAGARQVELNALAQAGRDRGCPLVVITQNSGKLPEEVTNNVKVWISFAQESTRELAFAAERLRIDPFELLEEFMPTGYAWVRSPNVNPRRVHLKLPRYSAPQSYVPVPTPSQKEGPTARRIVIEELARPETLSNGTLPPPSLKVQEILNQIDRTGHCHLWRGRLDRDGYGIVHMGGNWKRVHRVVWELSYGPIPVGEDGKALDLDHQCRSKQCVKLDHLEPVSRSENARRRWRVRGVRAAGSG